MFRVSDPPLGSWLSRLFQMLQVADPRVGALWVDVSTDVNESPTLKCGISTRNLNTHYRMVYLGLETRDICRCIISRCFIGSETRNMVFNHSKISNPSINSSSIKSIIMGSFPNKCLVYGTIYLLLAIPIFFFDEVLYGNNIPLWLYGILC